MPPSHPVPVAPTWETEAKNFSMDLGGKGDLPDPVQLYAARCLLDPAVWLVAAARGMVSLAALRMQGGLRAPLGEQLYEGWRQRCGATAAEAEHLFAQLEDLLALQVATQAAGPAEFFQRYRAKLLDAKNSCLALEVRLLHDIDPLAASQVETRAKLLATATSTSTAGLVAGVKLLTLPRGRKGENARFPKRGRDSSEPRKCYHCGEAVPGSIVEHLRRCQKNPKHQRDKGPMAPKN